MKKQKKSISGMSLAVVIIFITLMSLVAVAMLITASAALRSARILPEADGHFYSAEAAMNRALPRIVERLVHSDAHDPAVYAAVAMQDSAFFVVSSYTGTIYNQNTVTDLLSAPGSPFRAATVNAINTFLEETLGPMPEYVDFTFGAWTPTTIGGTRDFFWHSNADVNPITGRLVGTATVDDVFSAVDGFAAPAFVNFHRNPANTSQIYVRFSVVTSPSVPSPVYDNPDRRAFPVSVFPYVIVTSYAETAAVVHTLNMYAFNFVLPFTTTSTPGSTELDSNSILDGARGGCSPICRFHPSRWTSFYQDLTFDPPGITIGNHRNYTTIRINHANDYHFFRLCCYMDLFRGNPFPNVDEEFIREHLGEAATVGEVDVTSSPHFVNIKDAITYLLRQSMTEMFAAQPTQSTQLDNRNDTGVYDVNGIWIPLDGDFNDWLYDVIGTARYLRIGEIGHELSGELVAPNLEEVFAPGGLRIQAGTTFKGPRSNPTTFIVDNLTVNAGTTNPTTLRYIEFHTQNAIWVRGANGSLQGNAKYITYDGHISFDNINMTVGEPTQAPQFYSGTHVQALPNGLTFYGVLAALVPPSHDTHGDAGNPITITGMVMNAINNVNSGVNDRVQSGSGTLNLNALLGNNHFVDLMREMLLGEPPPPPNGDCGEDCDCVEDLENVVMLSPEGDDIPNDFATAVSITPERPGLQRPELQR